MTAEQTTREMSKRYGEKDQHLGQQIFRGEKRNPFVKKKGPLCQADRKKSKAWENKKHRKMSKKSW